MILSLSHPTAECNGKFRVTGSKSESNRLLVLQALFSGLNIENISESDDSKIMQEALKSDSEVIDVHHAGTSMRFLTAYFANLEGREVLLTGSQRMQERPIKILVEALKSIGASISYEKEEGYPPIRIKGKNLIGGKISLSADVSSQYISALLLIGAGLEKGIQLNLLGKITSTPYISMTLSLLDNLGIETEFQGQTIRVEPIIKSKITTQIVESDWSSASYFFSVVALADQSEIHLTSYKEESLQGDSVLKDIYSKLGVISSIEDQTLKLTKQDIDLPELLELDLSKAPDIAQTIAVTCYGLGVGCKLKGLHTLKIKETDRLQALYNELTKLGAHIKITGNSLELASSSKFIPNRSIPSYNDHRMAMAFAPLAIKIPIKIEDAEVVSKSFPTFWSDLEEINFIIDRR